MHSVFYILQLTFVAITYSDDCTSLMSEGRGLGPVAAKVNYLLPLRELHFVVDFRIWRRMPIDRSLGLYKSIQADTLTDIKKGNIFSVLYSDDTL